MHTALLTLRADPFRKWYEPGWWFAYMCRYFNPLHPAAFSSQMSLDALITAMSRLPTSWDTVKASSAPMQNTSTTSSLISVPPDPSTSSDPILDTDFDPSHPERLFKTLCKVKPKFLPLEMLPCANVHTTKFKICPKWGIKACSACKLVSYCCKVCRSSSPMQHT
jgi:hypothetical protein